MLETGETCALQALTLLPQSAPTFDLSAFLNTALKTEGDFEYLSRLAAFPTMSQVR